MLVIDQKNEFTRLSKMLQSCKIMQDVWKMNRICDYLKINILKQSSHRLIDNAGKRPGKSIYKATKDVAKLQKYAKCTKNESNWKQGDADHLRKCSDEFPHPSDCPLGFSYSLYGLSETPSDLAKRLPIWPNRERSCPPNTSKIAQTVGDPDDLSTFGLAPLGSLAVCSDLWPFVQISGWLFISLAVSPPSADV